MSALSSVFGHHKQESRSSCLRSTSIIQRRSIVSMSYDFNFVMTFLVSCRVFQLICNVQVMNYFIHFNLFLFFSVMGNIFDNLLVRL